MSKAPISARVEPRLQLLPGIGLVDLNHPELVERLADIAAEHIQPVCAGHLKRRGD